MQPLRVSEITQDADGVTAAGVRARYVLAADGLHSRVRAGLGLDRPAPGPARYGLRQHFAVTPWTSHVEVHWAADAEAYVTPVAPGAVGVAVLSAERRPFGEHLARSRHSSHGWAVPSRWTTCAAPGPCVSEPRRMAGRVLLVGDAAGYVDALTGEGIAVGLASAQAAVDAVLAGRPERLRAGVAPGLAALPLAHGVAAVGGHAPGARGRRPCGATVPELFGAVVDQLAA